MSIMLVDFMTIASIARWDGMSSPSYLLTYIPIWVYNKNMARMPTTHDAFNAVAEPKRRELLDAIGSDEMSVNMIVELLGWPQPMISKHLGVLKKVGLVSERRMGRQRLYRVNADQLKPIHDWVTPFERYWQESFERLDEYLEKEKSGRRK